MRLDATLAASSGFFGNFPFLNPGRGRLNAPGSSSPPPGRSSGCCSPSGPWALPRIDVVPPAGIARVPPPADWALDIAAGTATITAAARSEKLPATRPRLMLTPLDVGARASPGPRYPPCSERPATGPAPRRKRLHGVLRRNASARKSSRHNDRTSAEMAALCGPGGRRRPPGQVIGGLRLGPRRCGADGGRRGTSTTGPAASSSELSTTSVKRAQREDARRLPVGLLRRGGRCQRRRAGTAVTLPARAGAARPFGCDHHRQLARWR